MSNELSISGNNQLAESSGSATSEIMLNRQAQEVQASMVIAKKFPRDEIQAINRVLTACQRKGLAEKAMYEYPRGGQKVTGPSIRLAETIAQNWGNLDFGIMELEQKNGESHVMAYAWDLETNTRQTKVFTVAHKRHTRSGDYALTDPRDIYEMVANQGARRLRACILGVIPGDVVEDAIEACKQTIVNGQTEPLIDRVRKGIKVFEEKFSVTKDMLEKFIGCKAEAFSEQDMLRLNNVFMSLKDGMAKREDYFDIPAPTSNVDDPFAKKDEEEPKEEKKAKTTKTKKEDVKSDETDGK